MVAGRLLLPVRLLHGRAGAAKIVEWAALLPIHHFAEDRVGLPRRVFAVLLGLPGGEILLVAQEVLEARNSILVIVTRAKHGQPDRFLIDVAVGWPLPGLPADFLDRI